MYSCSRRWPLPDNIPGAALPCLSPGMSVDHQHHIWCIVETTDALSTLVTALKIET